MFDKEWIASFLVKFFCKFRKSFALKIFVCFLFLRFFKVQGMNMYLALNTDNPF